MNEPLQVKVRFNSKEDFDDFVKKSGLPLTEAVKYFDFTKFNPIDDL